MDFNKLLQNKQALIGAGAGLVLIIILVAFFAMQSGNKNVVVKEKVIKETFNLLTTDSMGKALEIQALLARQGIEVNRIAEGGTKISLTMKDFTMSQRDRALLAVVRSGMVDEHTGLEIFDKGDFTSTKDDKKIRLIRAINGELSRLIRKLPKIENASVFISIPAQGQSMFTSMQKPVTATVQVSVSPATENDQSDVLDKETVKAITNLLLGSVQDLESANISITDTNGHVYSSIIGAADDMMSAVEESDNYMRQKVQSQLDRLIGKGKYVVTVSTYLREIPIEKNSVLYDPQQKSVLNAQRFSENLGDQSADKGSLSSAVSSYLPTGLPQSANSSQNRNYNRSAEELQYGVSKTQVTSYEKPGTIEEISIAVTVEEGSLPPETNMDDLKRLISGAASPKVNPNNVSIVFSSAVSPYLAEEKPLTTPPPETSGNPWWTIPAVLLALLISGLVVIANKVKTEASKQESEIKSLHEKTVMQDKQLRDVNARAAALLAQQEQLHREVINSQSKAALPTNLAETLNTLNDEFENEPEEEISQYLRSWIESSN